jgi:hypothetical protein
MEWDYGTSTPYVDQLENEIILAIQKYFYRYKGPEKFEEILKAAMARLISKMPIITEEDYTVRNSFNRKQQERGKIAGKISVATRARLPGSKPTLELTQESGRQKVSIPVTRLVEKLAGKVGTYKTLRKRTR